MYDFCCLYSIGHFVTGFILIYELFILCSTVITVAGAPVNLIKEVSHQPRFTNGEFSQQTTTFLLNAMLFDLMSYCITFSIVIELGLMLLVIVILVICWKTENECIDDVLYVFLWSSYHIQSIHFFYLLRVSTHNFSLEISRISYSNYSFIQCSMFFSNSYFANGIFEIVYAI